MDTNTPEDGQEEIINQAWKILSHYIQNSMAEMFVRLDGDLLHFTEDAPERGDEGSQTEVFEAMRNLGLLKTQSLPTLLQILDEQYRIFWQGGTILAARIVEEEQNCELSLMDMNVLEEELAVITMTNKSNDACQMELLALNMRLAKMRGVDELNNESNPVAPAMLTVAFREVLSEWDLDPLGKKAAYRAYERTVMSGLDQLYKRLNQHLAEQGILPELQDSVANLLGHQQASRTQGSGTGGAQRRQQPAELAEEDTPSLEELWQHVRQLETMVPSGGMFVAADPGLAVMSRSGVLEALSGYQAQALEKLPSEADWTQTSEQIRQQIGNFLASNQQRIGMAERQTIDVILMLFNHVLEDPNLPDAMRGHIARLQIPVLKAAIVDDSFLTRHSHPARKLVDDLAQASVGWRDDGNRDQDSLYMQVKHAVDRIVHEFDDDIALFEEVRNDFARYMARQEQTRRIQEERLARSASGEDKITLARQQVKRLLRELEVEQQTRPVRELLNGPWSKLLRVIWLNEGENGRNWQKATEIARILTRELPGTERKYDQQKLVSLIPEITRSLEAGLTFVGVEEEEKNRLIEGLQGLFIRTLLPHRTRPEDLPREEEEENLPEAESLPPEESELLEEESREPDEHDELAASLAEDEWIRLLPENEEEGEPRICKLVWRSKYTGTMVFVDGLGNKSAQMKEQELARRFREGSAELVEDVRAPLIDRALRRMMQMIGAEVGRRRGS